MAPETKVREATAEDAEAIYVLAGDLAGAVGDTPPKLEAVRGRLRDLLETPRARVIVAEQGGEVLGAASLWIKPDLAHGDATIEVPMLVVSESHRRSGVGKLLMEEIQTLALANDTSVIELVATRDNTAAREFYRSLGFVEADLVALEFVGDLEDPPDPDKQ